MNRSALRGLILVTGLITAIVHLVVLNIPFLRETGSPDILFTLNGLGYLGLLSLFFTQPAFVADQWDLFHYLFMAFAAVTIVAFFALGGTGFGGTEVDPLGYLTKLDEVILIVALWRHMGRAPEPTTS